MAIARVFKSGNSQAVRLPKKFRAKSKKLEASGKVIGKQRLWIAAHPMAAGLILVTNNEKEFRRVRGLKTGRNSTARAASR
jgi:hypothetical protein